MYATLQNMIDQFSIYEVIQLTDRERNAAVDANVAENALKDASLTIDTYLSRYVLPFKIIPDALRRPCCDIARYYLCGAITQETDVIRIRYEDAIRWLERVARGDVTLGITDDGDAIEADDDLISFVNSDNKVFSRNKPRG